MQKEEISGYFQQLQDRICQALEAADGKARFAEDLWQHHTGGGGRSRIMEQGTIIEKGGVNFSAVWGPAPDNLRQLLQVEGATYFATGVSIVIHPQSPLVPIIHLNVRYFEMEGGVHWFGGGIDLTPHYVDETDARYFHCQLKAVCDQHHPDYYPQFNAWADDYFYIKHRQETRGIGGIFFDRLSATDEITQEERFAFVRSVGELFAPLYTHLMQKNASLPYGEAEKKWQLARRGRYVEFNLVYDKGTRFGLETEGRTESILMSLPPQAQWQYNYQPPPDSREAQTVTYLKKGVHWV